MRETLGTDDLAFAQILLDHLRDEVGKHQLAIRLGLVDPARLKRTFDEAVQAYLDAQRRSNDTVKRILKIRDVIGPKTTCEEINQEFLTEVAKGLTRPGSTPASFKRQVIAPVAAVLRFANSQWGAGQGCPLQTFRSVRQPIVSKNILWPSEAQDLVRLASANGDYQLVAIIVIGVCEGLRRAELHNLRWTAIDRMRQVTMVEDCKGDEFDKRTRIISDARPATWAALDHLKRQRDQTSDRLFTGVRGDPVGLQAFGNTTNAALRKLAAQAGIRKRVHLHLLRHSAASWHYAVVKDFERVRVRMDWRSLAITHRYVHLLPPHLVSEVEDFWNAKGFD